MYAETEVNIWVIIWVHILNPQPHRPITTSNMTEVPPGYIV